MEKFKKIELEDISKEEIYNNLQRCISEKIDYWNRINKAIEYIKETACYITDGKNKEMCVDDINYDECMELLRILRGEDNE